MGSRGDKRKGEGRDRGSVTVVLAACLRGDTLGDLELDPCSHGDDAHGHRQTQRKSRKEAGTEDKWRQKAAEQTQEAGSTACYICVRPAARVPGDTSRHGRGRPGSSSPQGLLVEEEQLMGKEEVEMLSFVSFKISKS